MKTPDERIYTLECLFSDTIDQVKANIQGKEGIRPDHQCLIFDGNLLEDGHTLADYIGYRGECTIHMVLRGSFVIHVTIPTDESTPAYLGNSIPVYVSQTRPSTM